MIYVCINTFSLEEAVLNVLLYATKQLDEFSTGQMKTICQLNSLVLLCPELCAITLEKV